MTLWCDRGRLVVIGAQLAGHKEKRILWWLDEGETFDDDF